MNGTMTPPREADKGLNLGGSFISKGIKGSRTLRIPPVQDYSSLDRLEFLVFEKGSFQANQYSSKQSSELKFSRKYT
jgi:hypothetical protein